MKNLFIATFIVFLCVSCEQKGGSEEIKEEIDRTLSVNEPEFENEIREGAYKSDHCVEDGRNGYISKIITVSDTSIFIQSIYHLNDDCSDVGYDRVYSYFDRLNDSIQYRKSQYVDMMEDGYQACNLEDLILGISYDIDDINCELSLENTQIIFEYMNDTKIKYLGLEYTI